MSDLVERLTVKDAYDIGVPLDEISLRTARTMPMASVNKMQCHINDAILEALVRPAAELSRLTREVEALREAALQEAALIAEQKYTHETVRKNSKGNPYPWGAAAIFAGKEIAKSIRRLATAAKEG